MLEATTLLQVLSVHYSSWEKIRPDYILLPYEIAISFLVEILPLPTKNIKAERSERALSQQK